MNVIQASKHMERMLMNRLTERYCCAFLHEKIELELTLVEIVTLSWEEHHYTFSVEEIQPNWACSLVDTDMSLQWDFTYKTSPQPVETTFKLTSENPNLHFSAKPNEVLFLTVLPSNCCLLQINGHHLFCVLFQEVPKSSEDYDEETPIGPHYNSNVIECDEECTIELSEEVRFRIDILDGSVVDIHLGEKKAELPPSDGMVCENCGKYISKSVFQVCCSS